MNNDEIKSLIATKAILDLECSDQDFEHGLRLMFRDLETGELGVLAVNPFGDPFEEECRLSYSYTPTETAFGTPPLECFIDDLKTRLEPDFEKGETPSLFG